jgi:Flp pilus assembly protein TadG
MNARDAQTGGAKGMKPVNTVGLKRRLSTLRCQRGQVLVMLGVSMLAVLAMAAFAVDVSAAYHTHRRTQAAADASAMSAAEYLPESPAQASNASASVAGNNLSDGTVTTVYSSTYTSNDTVTATAKATSPSYFAKVVGVNAFNAKATATATVGSYTGWALNIAPWAIPQQLLTWGQNVQFKTDKGGQGNFGGTQLPVIQMSCLLGTGGNDYRYLINNTEQSCLVNIGDGLKSKTGDLSGPTKQGLDERVVNGLHVQQNFNPYTILKQQPDGTYVLTTYQHPNLVVIPVVDQVANGSKPYTVVGFAWFIITSYTNKTVNGMFISSQAPSGGKCPTASDPNAACPVGAYNQLGIKVVTLTG